MNHANPHGGDPAAYARLAGCDASEILDFSASINPLGPPEWMRREVNRRLAEAAHYPDPRAETLKAAAAVRYGEPAACLAAGNGTSELLFALPRAAGLGRAVIPVPSYVDYERACRAAGLEIELLPMAREDGFRLDFAALDRELSRGPALVLAARPANPVGDVFDADAWRELAARRPESLFVADEAFADFVPGMDRLAGERPENAAVLLSLTKFFAVPGLRLGLLAGSRALVAALEDILPPWRVSLPALAVGERALAETAYAERTRRETTALREALAADLAAVAGLGVFPAEANFLLLELPAGVDGNELFTRLVTRHKVAVRVCGNFRGLGPGFVRVAVRSGEENRVLVRALAAELAGAPRPRPAKKTPALMVQGTCSDAGKSVLAAAFCRIFRQDGLDPAPFKAQNMSLNSFVTLEGLEMGRAQVTQARACGREPEARMNPVLLKPTGDCGSQVVVCGRAVGNMDVAAYVAFKEEAGRAARAAYDELAQTAGVMVIEGAGSPAEVNLAAHDIVNMRMAEHARARVLLVADIDRGGAYAALAGTFDCLPERHRRLVGGLVLNKFRGDPSLLAPANQWVREHTGVPVVGVVPWLADLGLPQEDSVAFKAARGGSRPGADIEVALVDLPRISNFTDCDALALEPDVSVRAVRSAAELGEPDMVVLPGSKNTLSDLAWLRESGLAAAILELPRHVEIVGLCGGLQMLGQTIDDPLGVESGAGGAAGLGLLPLATTLAATKTLVRVGGRHHQSGEPVAGYEIHHGVSTPGPGVRAVILGTDGAALGYGRTDRPVWGTYLHGVFDADGFRGRCLERLRKQKGLPAFCGPRPRYDIDPALDRLAAHVRQSLDMDCVYALLGI